MSPTVRGAPPPNTTLESPSETWPEPLSPKYFRFSKIKQEPLQPQWSGSLLLQVLPLQAGTSQIQTVAHDLGSLHGLSLAFLQKFCEIFRASSCSAFLLPSCVTLSNLLNLSVVSFLHLYISNDRCTVIIRLNTNEQCMTLLWLVIVDDVKGITGV